MLSLIIAILCILSYLLVDPVGLALWPTDLRWWQFISYGFAHVNVLHLILNLLALVSFGPALEKAWGRWTFLLAYLLCVVLGGAAQAMTSVAPIVGASAGIIGLFAAFTIAHPHKRIVSLFIVELPAWVVLAAYVILSAAALVFHWAVGIGHAAHLAGITAGVLCALTVGNKKPPLN